MYYWICNWIWKYMEIPIFIVEKWVKIYVFKKIKFLRGIFIFSYIISLVFFGFPVLYLEIYIGQIMQKVNDYF